MKKKRVSSSFVSFCFYCDFIQRDKEKELLFLWPAEDETMSFEGGDTRVCARPLSGVAWMKVSDWLFDYVDDFRLSPFRRKTSGSLRVRVARSFSLYIGPYF